MEQNSLSNGEIKALLVDDERPILDLLARIMRTLGVTPITAINGEAALAKFNEEKPDIVFSDIYMPKLNGIALLKKIKAVNPKLPFVLFTGYHNYKQLIENNQFKPDTFLGKPLDVMEIIELMLKYFPQLRKQNVSRG